MPASGIGQALVIDEEGSKVGSDAQCGCQVDRVEGAKIWGRDQGGRFKESLVHTD